MHWLLSLWPLRPDTCKNGRSQSPIDIVQDFTSQPGQIKFSDGYQAPQQVWVTNNGHTYDIEIIDKSLYIEVDGLSGKYKFERCHFHWGADVNEGSEHTLDGQKFPMEMHMIHYSEQYPSLAAAIASNNQNALTVLGILFQVDGVEEPNVELDKIVYKIIQDPHTHEKSQLEDTLTFTGFLPNFDLSQDTIDGIYYQYLGSLTTPPCSEVVTWTVFSQTINATSSQVSAFRELRDSEDNPLLSNFRPTQPQGKRTVEKYEHFN